RRRRGATMQPGVARGSPRRARVATVSSPCPVCYVREGPRTRVRSLPEHARQLALEQLRELLGRELQPGVKRAELAVLGARLVEAHLVDELLERHRIVGEQIDAPLPVVE